MEETQIIYSIYSKNRFKLLFLLSLVLNVTFDCVYSQQVSEIGLPYIQNYSSDQYKGASQNWDILQSKEGIIYIGNNEGILEYDGTSWRTIQLPNFGVARAMAIDENNRIYVGGYNELGYLEPDNSGLLKFTSLKEDLEDKNFQQIEDISAHNNIVYFRSEQKIFEWKNNAFSIHDAPSGFNLCKTIGENVFVVKNKVELIKISANDSQEIINASTAGIKAITDVALYKNNELLLLTYGQGLFVTNNGKIEHLNLNTSIYLEKWLARRILKLRNGNYVIGTIKNGIITIDQDGNIVQAVNKDLGLQDNVIFRLFEDQQKGVWAATNNGVFRIELQSPYSIFDDRKGIEGYVNDITLYNGKIYAANYNGVLRLEEDSIEGHKLFKNVGPSVSSTKISSKQAIEFLISKDTLFAGTRAGLFVFVNHKLVQQIDLQSGALFRSKKNPKRIYVGLIDGLASIIYKNGKWQNDGKINGIVDDIREIVEDSDGNLWLESQNDGVWKVTTNLGKQQPVVKHFKANEELPEGILFLRFIKDKVLFNIDHDVYSYNKQNDSIIRDSSINELLKLPGEISLKREDKKGNLWMFAQIKKDDKRRSRIKAIKTKGGNYMIQKNFDERITQDVGVAHFPEDNNVVWYGGSGGIIRHDLDVGTESSKNFKTLIRKVTFLKDSLLYGGARTEVKPPSLKFKENALRFEYSSTSFDDESKNQFQYILEGFDEDWSEWTSETKKDYTNISEGDYSFKVRSKNVFNHVSTEDNYSFAVLPPWYRTWWAYVVYVLGTIGIVGLYSKWRSNELQKKNIRLENIINKRTQEIRQKNELLSHQTEQLELLNEAKTKLYSNITHEFRTPLTVILGMADTLKSKVKEESFEGAENSLEMIRRNGKNLLQLVNEMLDLAKVESGSMELNLVQTDAIPFVKYLSESFHSLAQSKNINLTIYSEIDSLEMDIDVNKVASIISNLLSNAIKFTPAHGKIIVHLNKIKSKEIEFFQLKVQDNGLGLAEDDIAHLFDRFYQVENESSHKQQGTGIGLSLANEFVELMKGTIAVESTFGKGSTFIVQLPVTNKAIKTADAKITVEPSLNKTTLIAKTIPSFLDETSTLPLALIIEDNDDVAHYLKTCLKGKYQTLHANNGNIGIEMAYEKIPDIIISDVMMPGKDGYEVCATLKTDERTDHIPIILLTAKVTTADRLTGLTHGADAYLGKPFIKEELFTRLDQLILVRKKLIGKLEKHGFAALVKNKIENPQTKFLQHVIKVIHDNLDDADFGTSQLAKEIHLSESQIYRKLKAITDKSTAVFIRSIRLQKAKELIETTNKTISEIAYEVGFNDPSWFSRAFKDEFGISPSSIHK